MAAMLVLFLGYFVTKRISFLEKYSIPEPVVGGILFALLVTVLKSGWNISFELDMTLKTPLMIAFFTTIGLGAKLSLLKEGGLKVFIFLSVSMVLVMCQNVAGMTVAYMTDAHPLVGLLAGSITMVGGHGTGATFAGSFLQSHNLQASMELAMAAATFGLVFGGLVGGPVAQRLIKKHKLKSSAKTGIGQLDVEEDNDTLDLTPNVLLEGMLVVSIPMALGQILYHAALGYGISLPGFVWSLFLGILILNVTDITKIYEVKTKAIDTIGTVSLSLFLAMALMSLKLWELVNLAGPLLAVLITQMVIVVSFAYFITFRIMGSNYDAAVMAAGQCGFGMGATPTAVANMESVVAKYGAAPVAFLVVPLVGAFFIDITNVFAIQIALWMIGG
jgi:ESS family glutamate:Na+ symporter